MDIVERSDYFKQNNRFGYMKILVPKTKWVLLLQFYSNFIFIIAMFS